MKRSLPYLIPLALLLLLVSVHSILPDEIESLKLRFFDFYQRQSPRIYEDTPVRIVDVDEDSLRRFGQWPWPRSLMAELVNKLNEGGASVIAFDVIFAEPDRTSPRNIIPLWPVTPETALLKDELNTLPDHDRILAEAISKAPVVLAVSLQNEKTRKYPEIKGGFAFGGDDPRQFLVNFEGAIKSLDELEKAAKGNGVINYLGEYDGVIRRVPMVFELHGNLYPSLVAESLRVYTGAKSILIKSSGASSEMNFNAKTGIVSIKIGDLTAPTDARGQLWLYDTGPIPERSIPAWRVLAGETRPGELKGKIFFIGTSAAGLKDLRSTPLDPLASGVEIHAQLAEQILLHEFLNRPDWAWGAEICFMILVGLILIFTMPSLGATGAAIAGGVCFVSIYVFSWLAFTRHHMLIDPLIPSLACVVIYIACSLIDFLRTEREKKQIRNAFSQYLAPAIVEELARDPDRLQLGGEMKYMTILFADILAFTTISEQFQAQELTHFINRFLTPMTRIILDKKGTIDKYMGDCVMAFWNAPLDDPDHAVHACEAAVEMQHYLKQWNRQLAEEARQNNRRFIPIEMGIGVNTGDACVGNMGSEQRFDYSVLGDSVNLASRMEGLSRLYGVPTIVGEETLSAAGELTCMELDLIRVKGKTIPSKVYALFGVGDASDNESLGRLIGLHGSMLEAYRSQNWDEAESLVSECLAVQLEGIDLAVLYALYLQRITTYREQPPGAGWDGVAVATSK